jgi:2-polyprenyl-6-methoxyphenol hydroxylase-like FAD-dependent oxidoreductase
MDPSFEGPAYTGLMNSGGYTSGARVSSPPETTNFIFGKKAFFGYHVSQTGYVYWFVNWVEREEPARGAFEGMTDADRRRHMLGLFRDDRSLIRGIIENADTTFPYFPSYVLPEQPSAWHKGPLVLLGDAAHGISPSSGQGASMALEDSGVLAKCLGDTPDLERAFATYERLRRERTKKMFDVGRRGDSGKYVVGRSRQWLRDLTTPIFLKLFANPKASEWMYSYRIDWNETTEKKNTGSSPRPILARPET